MIVALAGGVGGAKLSQGLATALPPGDLTVIVNTADDLQLFGLRISPDLDTVMYTLAGLANPVTGWGILGDTHNTLAGISGYGRNIWFQLGDRDFATHILRTERLRQGATLTEVTAELAVALDVTSRIIPMANECVATKIQTPSELLDFQEYFVGRRQQEHVSGIIFAGIEEAVPSPGLLDSIETADLIVFCPSNPLVSTGPILAVAGITEALRGSKAPVIAVSPIIGGKALKGPADKMMSTLGHDVSALGVARMYAGIVDGMVIDQTDEGLAVEIEALGMQVLATQIIMGDTNDRKRLALEIITFGSSLIPAKASI